MYADVAGTRLWYDIEEGDHEAGPKPTVVLLHGGPGSFDHAYFEPDFRRTDIFGRVVFLDLPDHGRSDWGNADDWSFERAGILVKEFCEVLAIERPIVLGHSFGGLVAIAYAAHNPGHPSGVILQSTFATFDLARVVEGFRSIGGDSIARIVERSYLGDPDVTNEEWERCWQLFGDWVPSVRDRAKVRRNDEFNRVGGRLMLEVDLRPSLAEIRCPSLVSVGELDPITPVWAAHTIHEHLSGSAASMHVVPRAGHFPWRDMPEDYWSGVQAFVEGIGP